MDVSMTDTYPAGSGRVDHMFNIYLRLHHFRRFVVAGCTGEPESIPLHYFYPLPADQLAAFRVTLTSLFANWRKEGSWLEVGSSRKCADGDMDFREAGRRFWDEQARHRSATYRSAITSVPALSPSTSLGSVAPYRHPFEHALAEVVQRSQSPVICGRIEADTLTQSAPYWYELSRGRFGQIDLPPSTLIILTGNVPPESFPASLHAALYLWRLDAVDTQAVDTQAVDTESMAELV